MVSIRYDRNVAGKTQNHSFKPSTTEPPWVAKLLVPPSGLLGATHLHGLQKFLRNGKSRLYGLSRRSLGSLSGASRASI